MNLPSQGIVWLQHSIKTPTFQLTSIEKPDISPYLVHMTGKKELLSILKCDKLPESLTLPLNTGFLKSCIPNIEGSSYYNSPVVCFTESPIFALDFFRYRSYRRWNTNQQFGIGFDKEYLIQKRRVRPVLYLDTETNKKMLWLCNKSENPSFYFSTIKKEDKEIKELLKKIKPLLFPLLEDIRGQGFMWEREWRCPHQIGMPFPYKAIKIICCPSEEKEEIITLLGSFSDNIEFVETWAQYDEVTDYLKRRKKQYDAERIKDIESITKIDKLMAIKAECLENLSALETYFSIFSNAVNQMQDNNVHLKIDEMKRTVTLINEQILKINKK